MADNKKYYYLKLNSKIYALYYRSNNTLYYNLNFWKGHTPVIIFK